MTRTMADSTNVMNLPEGYDMYAGYDDGHWPDAAAIAARFPGKIVLRITVFPSDEFGDVIDVEKGDATAVQAVAWVSYRRSEGLANPIVYCSESAWSGVIAAFNAARVTQPLYWVAGYPGNEGDAIPAGAIGHQWQDPGPYDKSIMVDFIPGIDPDPTPPVVPPVSTPPIEVDMNLQETLITETSDGNGDGWYLLDAPVQNVLSVTGNGPYPPDNGYWPSPVYSKQGRGSQTVISWTGAGKNGVVSFFVQVAEIQ